MITLYAIPMSSYCAKTRILLRHKGVAHQELPPPGGYGSEEYRRIVPSGNLPTLVHDGLMIADSEAIAEYLEDRFPDPPALPRDPADRARVRERSRFNDTRLDPEVRKLFPHVRPARRDAAVLAEAAGQVQARLGQLGRMLETTPEAGAALTIADCGLPITLFWIETVAAPLDLAIDWPASVTAYRDRCAALPAVAAEFATYRPLAEDWAALAGADKA